MLELLSPHFIWWSSASSPPLLLIRHGSPLSFPPLPSFCDSSAIPPSSALLLFTQPSLSLFPLFYFLFLPLFFAVFHHFWNMHPPSFSSAVHLPAFPNSNHFQPPAAPKKAQGRSAVFSLRLYNEWLVVIPAPRLNTEQVSGRWWWWW